MHFLDCFDIIEHILAATNDSFLKSIFEVLGAIDAILLCGCQKKLNCALISFVFSCLV